MAGADAAIRDPATRRLLDISNAALADKGELQTDLPDVDVPSQFDTTPTDTGIRESILRGTESAFQQDIAQVQERALGSRRFRAGSTSAQELSAARSAQGQRIEKLGQFELESQGQVLSALTPLAVEEGRGTTALGVADKQAAGALAVAGEQSAGAEAVQTLRNTGAEAVAEINAISATDTASRQSAAASAVATIRSAADQAVANIQSDTTLDVAASNEAIAEIRAEAATDVADIQAAGGVDVANIYATVQDRKVALEEANADVMNEIARIDSGLRASGQEFEQRMAEADVTGIWEAYGTEEMDAFAAANGSTRGTDAAYNPRYDFDNDGKINFEDFIQFVKLSDMGGVPTSEYQQFQTDVSQFDVTTTNGMQQWEDSFNQMVSDKGLDRAQAVNLAAMSLNANVQIASQQLGVEHMGQLIDLLIEGTEALEPEAGAAIITAAMAYGDFGLNIPLEHKDNAQDLLKNAGAAGDMGNISNLLTNPEIWHLTTEDLQSMSESETATYNQLDVNGDGLVNIDDYIILQTSLSGG